jgi:hypothetical protein
VSRTLRVRTRLRGGASAEQCEDELWDRLFDCAIMFESQPDKKRDCSAAANSKYQTCLSGREDWDWD